MELFARMASMQCRHPTDEATWNRRGILFCKQLGIKTELAEIVHDHCCFVQSFLAPPTPQQHGFP